MPLRDRSWIAALLLMAYSTVLVAAGHGFGPVILLLLFGSWSDWGMPSAFGWAGIGLSLLSTIFAKRALHLAVTVAAAILLIVSLGLFVAMTDSLLMSFVSLVPFAAALFFCGYCLCVGFVPRKRTP